MIYRSISIYISLEFGLRLRELVLASAIDHDVSLKIVRFGLS